MTNIFNGPLTYGRPWYEFQNQSEAGPVEILIYDVIGKDPWDDSGVGAKDFVEQLSKIPKDREIKLRINSPGGNVWDALAIHNALKVRRDKVSSVIEGIAASSASWLPLSGRSVAIHENALFMIHDPWSYAIGSADEMRKAADSLDKHKDVIVNIYAEKSRRGKDEISQKMSDETWMNGREAKEFGFADELLESANIQNSLSKFDLSGFRRGPDSLRNQQNSAARSGQKAKEEMKRDQIIALLNKHGIDAPKDATDEALLELLNKALANTSNTQNPNQTTTQNSDMNAVVLELRNTVNALNKQVEEQIKAREEERKNRIAVIVNTAIEDCRIPANQKDAWVARLVKDETLTETLNSLPSNKPGGDQVNIVITNEAPSDIVKHIKNLVGAAKATFIRQHENRILPYIANSNTIPTELKRDVIYDRMMRAFRKNMVQLSQFSTRFDNVPLQSEGGTAKLIVPFMDLETATSTDFDAADGYITGNTTLDKREVTIDKRKYQGLSFTSAEFRRQPFLKLMELGELKAEKLSVDAVTDVLSVVTAANYDITAISSTAANFESDDIALLRYRANANHWPTTGRSMWVDSEYDYYLTIDGDIKTALNLGSDQVIREGNVQRLFGFNYFPNANIPANGAEKVKGFAAFQSAILIGTAPIAPTDEVRAQLSEYRTIVDPDTGMALEIRRWGNPDFDESKEICEFNYGYAVGNGKALIRIVEP